MAAWAKYVVNTYWKLSSKSMADQFLPNNSLLSVRM